jgi:hypothetical protein
MAFGAEQDLEVKEDKAVNVAISQVQHSEI